MKKIMGLFARKELSWWELEGKQSGVTKLTSPQTQQKVEISGQKSHAWSVSQNKTGEEGWQGRGGKAIFPKINIGKEKYSDFLPHEA